MADDWQVGRIDDKWVRAIHDSPLRCVLVTTGGGSGAIARLLETPGASRTVLEASVPYSAPALSDWLGAPPEHYCSSTTARAMAMIAWQRAMRWAADKADHNMDDNHGDGEHVIAGVAATASLASDRPKRGPHRVHLALQTSKLTMTQSVQFVKGRRNRREEEAVTQALLLNLIASATDVEPLETGLAKDEPIETNRCDAPDQWRDLMLGRVALVHATAELSDGIARVVFAGAFNPLHEGHRRMADIAAKRLGADVTFEISIENVDKPPLDYIEIERRCGQFDDVGHLCLTRATTFVEKAELFPGATFVVGADTVRRIAEPRYYGNDARACQAAIERIAALGCHFLVFGRAADGAFRTLDDLSLPAELRAICREVSEDEFRADVSSTELRKAVDESE